MTMKKNNLLTFSANLGHINFYKFGKLSHMAEDDDEEKRGGE